MSGFSTWRTTRRYRRCGRRAHVCAGWVAPGDRYLEHRTPPGGELGNVGWTRSTECKPCAELFGRGEATT